MCDYFISDGDYECAGHYMEPTHDCDEDCQGSHKPDAVWEFHVADRQADLDRYCAGFPS